MVASIAVEDGVQLKNNNLADAITELRKRKLVAQSDRRALLNAGATTRKAERIVLLHF
jgi:hypothetical protein